MQRDREQAAQYVEDSRQGLTQRWRFVVVTDAPVRAKLAEIYKESFKCVGVPIYSTRSNF